MPDKVTWNDVFDIEDPDELDRRFQQAIAAKGDPTLTGTSTDGSITLTIPDPLIWAAIGMGWELHYEVQSVHAYEVSFVSDSNVVSGRVHAADNCISLSVGAGKARITVRAITTTGKVAEVSWTLETIMAGG